MEALRFCFEGFSFTKDTYFRSFFQSFHLFGGLVECAGSLADRELNLSKLLAK